jgi:hypothetical protein
LLRTRALLPAMLLSLLGAILVPAAPALAGASYDDVIDITFPVTGDDYRYVNDYDYARSRGAHGATDIMAPSGTPVVAAMGGTIDWVSTPDSSSCGYCLDIRGSDGRTYGYIHMGPNASGRTDEAFARSWRVGDTVTRGQAIAYVGCSGNASCSSGGHHLHFQIEDQGVTDPYGDGRRNPFYSLRAAEAACTSSGSFSDVCADNTHADDIERLLSAELTSGCGEKRFCPNDPVTREQMASFLVRALDLSGRDAYPFQDVDSSNVHHRTIARLAAERITVGCGDALYCPDNEVTRAQMASFLARALKLPDSSTQFDDVPSSNVHMSSIGALADAGITKGCNPPTNDRFCPNESVTRAQMASFLVRAFLS